MLQIIKNNINKTPKTLPNLIWDKIINGIELNNKELNYLNKYKCKNIIEYGLIENGCWIKTSYGGKIWYKNGKRHREDGPAIEYISGYKAYYKNGKLHREDGPAIIAIDGVEAHFINGTRV